MSVTAGVSDTVITIRDKLRGKIGLTKVKRYRPGKPPEWADDMTITRDEFALDRAFPIRRGSDNVGKEDDPRLRRLAESKLDHPEESIADHKRWIRQAEIVSFVEENKWQEELDLEEQDEDAMEDRRRRRIKEKVLQRQQLQVEALLPEEEEEEEEEEESEYETDLEEKLTSIAMVKPVFVTTSERDTIVERERLEAEEHALEDMMRRRLAERKVETKQIVVEEIRKNEETNENLDVEVANITDMDTDDNVNELEEYEAWKVREIARIKKDRDVREVTFKEKEEVEKVRNMTMEERREWEREKNRKPFSGFKQKWRFMQKYYHKGAFFQSETDDTAGATTCIDDIYTRDFSAPTGEDKMNKTILPKVMQVKHFGHCGRTKWTHLVNEDTTYWNNP